MGTPKPTKGKTTKKAATNDKAKRTAKAAASTRYASAYWERVYLLSVKLDTFAKELGLHAKVPVTDGFDLADAARELGRLAMNHNREANPEGRKPEQEKEDWVAVGGVGADLGNMADEGAAGGAADGVRAIAHELCYLACDFLF